MVAVGPHRRVEHRRHVHEQHRPLVDPALPHRRVRRADAGERRVHDRRRPPLLGHAQLVAVRPLGAAEAGQLGHPGVELGLVTVAVRAVAPPLQQARHRRRRVAQPAQEGVGRVTGHHDDRRLDDLAVPAAVAVAGRRARPPPPGRSPSSRIAVARVEQRIVPPAAVKAAASDAGPTRSRRPDARRSPRASWRSPARPARSAASRGRGPTPPARSPPPATAAPPTRRTTAARRPPTGGSRPAACARPRRGRRHRPQHAGHGRHVVGQLEHQVGGRAGRLHVAPVAVDLAGVGEAEALQRPLDVVEVEPGRLAAPPTDRWPGSTSR